MRHPKALLLLLLLIFPALAAADTTDIPGSATWYFHADFDAMRSGKAGRDLYDWLDKEIFSELRSEIGIDFDKEARRLTAYAGEGEGPIIVLDGKISQATRDKVLAIAAMDGELQPLKASGKTYYHFDGDHDADGNGKIEINIESLEEEAYVSVDLKDKIVITNTREQMEKLLASKGRIQSRGKDGKALLVLRADRSLIQAGVNAEEMQEGDDWDSNILRNTRQVAVLLADLGDKLGLEAQLLATEPEIANSLASIVRGLISLQAFNDDMDPEISTVLQSTRVDVAGSMLKLSLSLDPGTVVSALGD